MNSRMARLVACAILLFVAQVVWLNKIDMFGVHPDYTLPLALAIGITGGRNRGAVAGFIIGLGIDAFAITPVGLNALSYCFAGYVVASLADDSSGTPMVVAAVSLAGSVIAVALYALLGQAFGSFDVSLHRVVVIVAVQALLGLVFTPVFAIVVKRSWVAPEVAW